MGSLVMLGAPAYRPIPSRFAAAVAAVAAAAAADAAAAAPPVGEFPPDDSARDPSILPGKPPPACPIAAV